MSKALFIQALQLIDANAEEKAKNLLSKFNEEAMAILHRKKQKQQKYNVSP